MRLWLPSLVAAAVWFAATRAETAELAAFAAPALSFTTPAAMTEISDVQIGWRHDDLQAVFQAAQQDGLPVVVAAEGDDGALYSNVLRCPTFNSLAGQAHFILLKLPILNEASEAGRLVNALHMDPAFSSSIAVLRADGFPFREILRVRGYTEEAALLEKLASAGLSPRRGLLPLQQAAVGDEPPRDCVK
jgi:hypothetical protein